MCVGDVAIKDMTSFPATPGETQDGGLVMRVAKGRRNTPPLLLSFLNNITLHSVEANTQ